MKTDDIAMLIDRLDNSSLVELELKTDEFEISLRKKEAFVSEPPAPSVHTGTAISGSVQPAAAPVSGPVDSHAMEMQAAAAQSGDLIESPIVGTFYRSPSPDSPAFVEEGSVVKEGETLCILEAMKVMNELEADYDCKVVEILVENGQMVEYGTPLFRVERT